MLPDDSRECPVCGHPLWYGSGDYCDYCVEEAAKALHVTYDEERHEYIDRDGNNAYWRVMGLLARWSKHA
jgi:hypothetical protein